MKGRLWSYFLQLGWLMTGGYKTFSFSRCPHSSTGIISSTLAVFLISSSSPSVSCAGCWTMWAENGHRAVPAGGSGGGVGEERRLHQEQRPPPVALHHLRPPQPRSQEVLRQILHRLSGSHQWVTSGDGPLLSDSCSVIHSSRSSENVSTTSLQLMFYFNICKFERVWNRFNNLIAWTKPPTSLWIWAFEALVHIWYVVWQRLRFQPPDCDAPRGPKRGGNT